LISKENLGERKFFKSAFIKSDKNHHIIYKLEQENKTLKIILTIVIIVLFLSTACWIYKDSIQKLRKEYYKDQMINFCRIAEFYNDCNYPIMYHCEGWLVD